MKWSLTVAALCLSVPAFAAPIVIDNFNDNQFFGVGPGGINPISGSQSIVTGANSFGGARSVIITRTQGNGFEFVNVAAGLLEFNLGAADGGTAQIIWDGDTNPALNENGVGPVDLTDGGSNTHLIAFVRSDLIAPITFTVYSGAGNFSTFTFLTPGGGFVGAFAEYYLPFALFADAGGTGADFTGVTAITALLDGRNQLGADFQLDLVGAGQVPEPGTFGLAGLLLSGLVYVVRRRK